MEVLKDGERIQIVKDASGKFWSAVITEVDSEGLKENIEDQWHEPLLCFGV